MKEEERRGKGSTSKKPNGKARAVDRPAPKAYVDPLSAAGREAAAVEAQRMFDGSNQERSLWEDMNAGAAAASGTKSTARSGGKGSKRTGKGGGKGGNDWNCPKCAVIVFGSKNACFKCGTERPSGALPAKLAPKQKQGGGGGGRGRAQGKGSSGRTLV